MTVIQRIFFPFILGSYRSEVCIPGTINFNAPYPSALILSRANASVIPLCIKCIQVTRILKRENWYQLKIRKDKELEEAFYAMESEKKNQLYYTDSIWTIEIYIEPTKDKLAGHQPMQAATW